MYTVKCMQYVSVDKHLFTTCFHTLQLLKFDQPQPASHCILLKRGSCLIKAYVAGICITLCMNKSNWLVCDYNFFYKPLHNHNKTKLCEQQFIRIFPPLDCVCFWCERFWSTSIMDSEILFVILLWVSMEFRTEAGNISTNTFYRFVDFEIVEVTS
jgi:hypothetical protein